MCIFGFWEENEKWINFKNKTENLKSFKTFLGRGNIMDDFKKLTEQLLKIYINSESVNDLRIENYFDENISLIGTGQHEIYRNLHEFLESFEFDAPRPGPISFVFPEF